MATVRIGHSEFYLHRF